MRNSITNSYFDTLENMISVIKKVLANKPIDFAYLFGSAAYSLMHKESDIDIAVYSSSPLPLDKLIEIQYEIEDIFNRPVQIVFLDGILPLRFVGNTLDFGKVVKDSPVRVAWEDRMKNEIKKAILEFLKEKAGLIMENLDVVEYSNLNSVSKEELRRFIGGMVLVFAPIESSVSKIASTKGKADTFRKCIPLVSEELKLSSQAEQSLHKLLHIRNQLMHAYWQKLPSLNPKELKAALEEFATKLENYVDEESRITEEPHS